MKIRGICRACTAPTPCKATMHRKSEPRKARESNPRPLAEAVCLLAFLAGSVHLKARWRDLAAAILHSSQLLCTATWRSEKVLRSGFLRPLNKRTK